MDQGQVMLLVAAGVLGSTTHAMAQLGGAAAWIARRPRAAEPIALGGEGSLFANFAIVTLVSLTGLGLGLATLAL